MSTRQLARLPTISNRGGRLVFSSGRLRCQKDELVSSILLRFFRLFCCTQPFPLPCYNGPAATHQATPHLAFISPTRHIRPRFLSPADPATQLSGCQSRSQRCQLISGDDPPAPDFSLGGSVEDGPISLGTAFYWRPNPRLPPILQLLRCTPRSAAAAAIRASSAML
jgi:hypothetical protein